MGDTSTIETKAGTYEKFGTYAASTKRIKAELTLYKDAKSRLGPWYAADIHFETEPVWNGEKGGFRASAHYRLQTIKEIFGRMKRSEVGFEESLLPVTDHNYDWKSVREVMSCIHDLEYKVAKDHANLFE